jgi:ferredoxin
MPMQRKLKVSVDHNRCVGNGTCLTLAPHVFAHNQDRQSIVIDPAGDPEAQVLEAAENCPVSAITVVDSETGEQLFP